MVPYKRRASWLLAALPVLLVACVSAPRQEAPVTDRTTIETAEQARERAMLEAEAALERGDAEAAEFFLAAAAPPAGTMPDTRYRRAQAALAALRSDPVGQAVSRASIAVNGLREYDTNLGVALLQSLEPVPSRRLASLATGSNTLAAWADLALSVRRDLISNTESMTAASTWQADHPGHPVQAPEYLELCWQYRQRFRPPSRVAVLLPVDGPLKTAAEAVRDGLMMSWLDRPGPSRIDFLPLGEDPAAAAAAYRQAVGQGYTWIIGPLRRESVQRIAELPDLPVPVLLLNDPPAELSPSPQSGRRLFSLSLSQQAEAAAAARRALAQDHLRALVLAADDSWGSGVVEAFSASFETGGGEIIDTARFSPTLSDYSDILTETLRIEDSRQRKARLQAALGLPLEFEPSRRDDFDVIFMATDPVLGRQLKPQLRFYDAGDKPMLAMSRIYSGKVDPTADVDLNGIEFAATRQAAPDADGQADRLTRSRSGVFAPLQAIGADAWGLLPWIGLMQQDPDLVYPGASGKLSIAADGTLRREPWWMRFEDGRPVPVEPFDTP